MALSTFAADQDVTIVNDALTAIAPHARVAVTGAGDEIPYDVLLVATGGHAADAVHGALTFRGAGDGQAIRELLAAQPRRIAFAAPAGSSWPLPLYELALLSAAELRSRGAATEVLLATPEDAPLSLFGPAASDFAADLLARHGIEVLTVRHAPWRRPRGRWSSAMGAVWPPIASSRCRGCSGGASRASRATSRTSSRSTSTRASSACLTCTPPVT